MAAESSEHTATDAALEGDLDYQNAALQEVSRTFALTIPQLPDDLRVVVGNAYLLCRIADTIEDSTALSVEQKRHCSEMFVDAVAGGTPPEAFAAALCPLLDASSTPAEKDLIANSTRVLRLTSRFSEEDRAALTRCVRIMAEGMERFQEGRFTHGLRDGEQLDAYCYHVAGVVGEMLTQLFCAHSKAIAVHREELTALAVSFGQGLQMTNILKDVWDDKMRGVCWLPRSTFEEQGFDLDGLSEERHGKAFENGLARLISDARGHLEDALRYTLTIPRSEEGIRRFCLWAIGMAVLTLRKINRHRDFTSGTEVKISRRSVYATVVVTRIVGRNNTLLRWIFGLLAAGLPHGASESGPSTA